MMFHRSHTQRSLKQDPNIIPYTKIHLKQIKDLNMWPKTIKLQEERAFFDKTSKAQAINKSKNRQMIQISNSETFVQQRKQLCE